MRPRTGPILAIATGLTLALPVLPANAGTRAHRPLPTLAVVDTMTVPAGTTQLGTPFGGLSGIDYDPVTGKYIAISDDRSENAPARFYTLRLPFNGARFAADQPDVTGVDTLLDTNGQPFARKAVDAESIRWAPDHRSLYWTSEGAAKIGQPAFVREAGPHGEFRRELPLPEAYQPVLADGVLTSGVRDNLALESLTMACGGRSVVTATETALAQDGPIATLTAGSRARFLELDRATGKVRAEHVYPVDPIVHAPTAPLPAPVNVFSADRGLSEILALAETEYLTVERSFASGVGFTIQIYWTTTRGATDVMPKRLLLTLDAADGVDVDNIEGITWGPRFSDGSRSLILVSDDNFGFNGSVTKFVLLKLA
jgi:hypothetical protein